MNSDRSSQDRSFSTLDREADGSLEELVTNYQFYLGAKRFAEKSVLDVIEAAIDHHAATDREWAAKILAPSVGLPEDVIKIALARQSFLVGPVDQKIADAQQTLADTFFKLELKLIPKAVRIAAAMPAA